MNGRKWIILFVSALILVFAIWGGINIYHDPFGVFGEKGSSWDGYSMTLNPRIGKAEYLSRHFDEYDSYIVGSSNAASYLPETFEKYEDGSYYNMFHYGADVAYDEMVIRWLLKEDDVKHIVLILGLNEGNVPAPTEGLTARLPRQVTGENPISYYFDFLFADFGYVEEKLDARHVDTELVPQAFDIFLPESGTYDKRLRDVEAIASLDDYLSLYGGEFAPMSPCVFNNLEGCAASVSRIKEMCEAEGTKLTVIFSPVSEAQLASYTNEELDRFFNSLSEVTDYYNFSISSISRDPRYFYDSTHTRNATANMVISSVYGDESVYYPKDFGVYSEKGIAADSKTLWEKANATSDGDYTAHIPVLLYHHLDPNEEEDGTVLHPDTFARQMKLLRDNGYTSITFDMLIDYVEKGTPLPEKPVIITFDDGYMSNYEYALPILREYGMTASVFAIGVSVGHYETYKDTEHSMIPHFGKAEVEEMAGVIDVLSHTYDMHQWPPFETGDSIRETILPFEGESETDYIMALKTDVEKQNSLFAELGLPSPRVLAFPQGETERRANMVLCEMGYKVTLTTDSTKNNCIIRGLPQSLFDLGRLNISGETTDEEILAYCGR